MAYPAVRTTKENDNVVFSFLRLFTFDQAEGHEQCNLLFALGAWHGMSFDAANRKQPGCVSCNGTLSRDDGRKLMTT